MSQYPNYLVLILGLNVCLAIAEAIRRTFSAWSRFHRTHSEAVEQAISDQRDWEMVTMIVNLLDYLDRERQSDSRVQIKDLLQYGKSDYTVRLLEPYLQIRESLGAERHRLLFRSSVAKAASALGVVVLAVLAVDVSIAVAFLAFGVTVDVWAWYTVIAAAALASITAVLALISMHVMETRFSAHLATMRSARISQSPIPAAIRDHSDD